MRKLLLKLLIGTLSLMLLVSGLVACGSSSTDWQAPTLKNWGGVESGNGGFMVETKNYLYFINGVATSTDDNTFGVPVKGTLMVQDKNDFSKKPEIVVPKLFASADYNAGIYIYGDYVYYGTPSTDKDSSGAIANYEMSFARTKLDGSETEIFFSVSSSSINFRVIEQDGTVYIVYYSSADSAIYSYNTTTKEEKMIAKTNASAEGEEARSLNAYKIFDNAGVEQGYTFAYTVTIYDEEYYENKAQEEGYSRATKNYNEVFVYGKFNGKMENKRVLDGKDGRLTYAIHYLDGVNLYYTATDVYSNVENRVRNIKTGEDKVVVNMDIINGDNLILADGKVLTLAEGVVRLRDAFADDKATQKIIAKNTNISILSDYDGEYLYYYNTANTLCRIEAENGEAKEVAISEDIVSRAWYEEEYFEIGGKKYVFYLDSSTKGASYVKYVNLDKKYGENNTEDYIAEDTNDDGEADKFYLDGQEFLAKRTDADIATYVTSFVNDIITDLDANGALKFEENDNGELFVESVTIANELYQAQTDSVKAKISEATVEVLEGYVEAIKMANKYNTLKAMKNFDMLTSAQRTALETAYNAVKAEIEEFKKSKNYTSLRALLGNDLNAHYQKCVAEFEPEEE